ncbi:MAG: DVUA0089 family protein [Phycisphaerae bacterium]|nr:DVUA0089 family protein [Phycisphaerae bacterium]
MIKETREKGFGLSLHARRGVIATAVGIAAVASSSAFAGPDWDVDLSLDAGSSLVNAQIISIQSPVLRITGKLLGLALEGPGDFQDVYLFSITDPTTFRIDTTSGGGSADFDTCMWLFSYDGKPLLGNNDAEEGVLGSLLVNQSNDGPSVTITVPGLYYLAITGFPSQPLDGSEPLFPKSVFTPGNITGGLGERFNGNWTKGGATGNYVLDVKGVSGVPAPGAVALLAIASAFTGRASGRNRRTRA